MAVRDTSGWKNRLTWAQPDSPGRARAPVRPRRSPRLSIILEVLFVLSCQRLGASVRGASRLCDGPAGVSVEHEGEFHPGLDAVDRAVIGQAQRALLAAGGYKHK